MAGCDTGPFLLKESPTGVSVKLLFVQVGVSTEIGRVIIKTNKDFELSTTVFVPGNAKTGVALIIAEVQVDKKTRATRQASLTITAPQ
jgi:hypothetical protein